MMDRIVSGLSESSIKVRLAAVRYDAPTVPLFSSYSKNDIYFNVYFLIYTSSLVILVK